MGYDPLWVDLMRIQITHLQLDRLFGTIVAAIQADMDKVRKQYPSSREEASEYSMLWRCIASGHPSRYEPRRLRY